MTFVFEMSDGSDPARPSYLELDAGRDPRESDVVNCGNCSGLCCRKGTAIPLKTKEAVSLAAAGTLMHKMDKEEREGNRAPWAKDFYLLDSDCGNLDPYSSACGDYDGRPQACREFEVGSYACQIVRENNSLPIDLGMPQYRNS